MGALGFKTYDEFKTDVDKIIADHGQKDEKVLGFSLAQERPTMWWTILLGWAYAFIVKNDILALTNTRLHVIKLDMMNKPTTLESYSLDQLKGLEYKKCLLSDYVLIQFPEDKKRKFNFPKLMIKTYKEFPTQLATALSLVNT